MDCTETCATPDGSLEAYPLLWSATREAVFEPPLASHLVSSRAFYTHHGIYVGKGRVIHYSGLAFGLSSGRVEEVSLVRFANGGNVRVWNDTPSFDRREVMERALSRLGERRYSLLTNNCEHFCTWAMHGESRSLQVEKVLAAILPRGLSGHGNRTFI